MIDRTIRVLGRNVKVKVSPTSENHLLHMAQELDKQAFFFKEKLPKTDDSYFISLVYAGLLHVETIEQNEKEIAELNNELIKLKEDIEHKEKKLIEEYEKQFLIAVEKERKALNDEFTAEMLESSKRFEDLQNKYKDEQQSNKAKLSELQDGSNKIEALTSENKDLLAKITNMEKKFTDDTRDILEDNNRFQEKITQLEGELSEAKEKIKVEQERLNKVDYEGQVEQSLIQQKQELEQKFENDINELKQNYENKISQMSEDGHIITEENLKKFIERLKSLAIDMKTY